MVWTGNYCVYMFFETYMFRESTDLWNNLNHLSNKVQALSNKIWFWQIRKQLWHRVFSLYIKSTEENLNMCLSSAVAFIYRFKLYALFTKWRNETALYRQWFVMYRCQLSQVCTVHCRTLSFSRSRNYIQTEIHK